MRKPAILMQKKHRSVAHSPHSLSAICFFATWILYFLTLKFQASSRFLWLKPMNSQVCVTPGRKPKERFSHDAAQVLKINFDS